MTVRLMLDSGRSWRNRRCHQKSRIKDQAMATITAKDLINEEAVRFAKLLCALKECSQETQDIVCEMASVFTDEEATEEDRAHASDVITEALFPGLMHECVEYEGQQLRLSRSALRAKEELDAQEATFAERLRALMEKHDMSQERLAHLTGVGQPAISNMLNRKCRPQRRTIARFAEVFGVRPEELWPDVAVSAG